MTSIKIKHVLPKRQVVEEVLNEATVQYVEGSFGSPKTESILPLYAPAQKRGYDGETQSPAYVSFVTD